MTDINDLPRTLTFEFSADELNDIRRALDSGEETSSHRKTVDEILCLLVNDRRVVAHRDPQFKELLVTDTDDIPEDVYHWEFAVPYLNEIRAALEALKETDVHRRVIDRILRLLSSGRSISGRQMTEEQYRECLAASVSPS